MTRPRLLDLFCGQGGATRGYQLAGFYVVGVDNKPMPRHCGDEFIQADALEYVAEHGHEFDAIHASPPCQAYSIMRNLPWLKDREYWDSVPPTRAALEAVGVPWVIENVQGAPMDGIMLCGQMFGLRQPDGRPEYRHRLFESTVFMLAPGHPKHYEAAVPGHMLGRRQDRLSGIVTGWKSSGIDRGGVGHSGTRKDWGLAVGIDWMDREGLSQAIPPAYTEWIGERLMASLISDTAPRGAVQPDDSSAIHGTDRGTSTSSPGLRSAVPVSSVTVTAAEPLRGAPGLSREAHEPCAGEQVIHGAKPGGGATVGDVRVLLWTAR